MGSIPQAILDQSSGPRGDDIELGAISNLFGDSGAALFMRPGTVPAFSPDLVDQGLQQYDVVDNQFGGVVPVPADTAPGPYQVVAWCLDAGEPAADPVVLGYTVLAPGAVPVPADPAFTRLSPTTTFRWPRRAASRRFGTRRLRVLIPRA